MNLTVLLCLWNGWRAVYEPQHVRGLARMLRTYLKVPFRIVLLTDQPALRAQALEVDAVQELPPEPMNLRPLSHVNCYRRLRFFDPDYAQQFNADYLLSIDLDTLIVDDITACITEAMQYPFKILRGLERPYNGAFWLLRCGEYEYVWKSFDGEQSPQACRASGWTGSDQVWLSLTIPDAPTWGPEDGFYFLDQFLASSDDDAPPRVLNYSGPLKPWAKKNKTPDA